MSGDKKTLAGETARRLASASSPPTRPSFHPAAPIFYFQRLILSWGPGGTGCQVFILHPRPGWKADVEKMAYLARCLQPAERTLGLTPILFKASSTFGWGQKTRRCLRGRSQHLAGDFFFLSPIWEKCQCLLWHHKGMIPGICLCAQLHKSLACKRNNWRTFHIAGWVQWQRHSSLLQKYYQLINSQTNFARHGHFKWLFHLAGRKWTTKRQKYNYTKLLFIKITLFPSKTDRISQSSIAMPEYCTPLQNPYLQLK